MRWTELVGVLPYVRHQRLPRSFASLLAVCGASKKFPSSTLIVEETLLLSEASCRLLEQCVALEAADMTVPVCPVCVAT